MREPALLRDLAFATAAGLVAWVIAGTFDLHELFFDATRGVERLQLDELPIVLAAFALSLALLLARRHAELTGQLAARRAAETVANDALSLNRRLARHALELQERERRHLAREVHDELGQVLSVVMLDAVALADAPGAAAGASQRLVAGVGQAQSAAARLVRRLRPAGLDELGLAAALEHLVDTFRLRLPATAFRIDLAADVEVDAGAEEPALTIYRVAQEALTNIARHASPRDVGLSLHREGGDLLLAIEDDGVGFDVAGTAGGFGLAGMRERVELCGGRLQVDSRSGQGTRILARLPVAGGPAT